MNYWQYHDRNVKQLKSLYSKVSKQTQKRLQEVINLFKFDFESLYSIANSKNKKMIDTQIEEWEDKGLLQNEFGIKAKNIKNRTRVRNNEILELLIYGAYIEEQQKVHDTELNIIKEDINYYYKKGQEEVNNALPVNKRKALVNIPELILLSLLNKPIIRGYQLDEYIQSTMQYNTEQIYRQAVIDMQQLKEVKIDSDVYQRIINKQQNAKLCINDEKISGALDNAIINLDNQSKLEGIQSIDNNAKVKFVAVEDNVTTKMCKSLDGQIFNAHDWNEFERYSDTNKAIKKYKCYGLIQGLNLPQIDDNFHWCRSTIQYMPPIVEKNEEKDYNSIEEPRYRIQRDLQSGNIDNERKELSKAINKLPESVKNILTDTIFEIGNTIASRYNRKLDILYIRKGSDKYEILHEIGHAFETKANILNNSRYIKIQEDLAKNSAIIPTYKFENKKSYIIKNRKLISDYQGYMYIKNIQDGYDAQGNIRYNLLGEVFSEGFRQYFKNKHILKEKNKELYIFIKEVLK